MVDERDPTEGPKAGESTPEQAPHGTATELKPRADHGEESYPPGPVWTPLIPSTMSREHVATFGEDTLWKRPAQPAEIAPGYVFLASADARCYSGEVLSPTARARLGNGCIGYHHGRQSMSGQRRRD